jgi:hypothetical protein
LEQRDAECHVGDQNSEDDEKLETLKLAAGHRLVSVGTNQIAYRYARVTTLGGLSGAYEGVPSGARLTWETEYVHPRRTTDRGYREQGRP